ncbi:MAG TPA: hypothetical protein VFI47_27395 [Acidimicrobiales bacterium]|nr:hypothetical protein [Acidimicrobiales bacterium]
MPRRTAALVALASVALSLTLALAGAAAGPAGAAPPAPGQEPDAPADDGTDGRGGSETTEGAPVPDQRIIPRPDSGAEPSEAGDRGGALQVLVLVLMVGGVVAVATLARRDMRRGRAGQS